VEGHRAGRLDCRGIVQQHGLDIDFDFFLQIAMEASATRLVGYILVSMSSADVEGI
jgi:hypothetical protein